VFLQKFIHATNLAIFTDKATYFLDVCLVFFRNGYIPKGNGEPDRTQALFKLITTPFIGVVSGRKELYIPYSIAFAMKLKVLLLWEQ